MVFSRSICCTCRAGARLLGRRRPSRFNSMAYLVGGGPIGHNTLGVLPRSVRWREVVASLQTGTEDREVVAASARAAETDLLRAGSDPVFIEAVRLLLEHPVRRAIRGFRAGAP